MGKKIIGAILVSACVFSATISATIVVHAVGQDVNVTGDVYEFSKKDSYGFENSEATGTGHVDISIVGDVTGDGARKGIPAYAVNKEEPVSFSYAFDSKLIDAADEEWHLVSDKSKKVNDVTLDEDIQKGAMVLQISNDGEKWITVDESVNVFAGETTASFYEPTELELLNGCYYRVIVAYELGKKGKDSKILFVTKKNYDYQKYAEVFKAYLYDKDGYTDSSLDNIEKVRLGKRIRTEDEGYARQKDIDKDDPHYGWDLGEFFISGFTSKNTIDGKKYVLKNVGDTVTLGFYLSQDIDKLNGKDALSISRDKDGYDKAFEISQTDFGRGTLIIQYTDADGITHDPQIYNNYLEANLSPKANTAVKLCEEGDYEVALDYEVQNDNKVVFGKSIFPEKTHYRIAFSFSVRNSNCMVYTFDSVTGSELKNGNVTDNGFKIDLANSQYLDVGVKREILEDGADGLTEDTKFNRKARDGEIYTDDGIYTITVKNKAAELESEKKIYVGTNKILKAYVLTGLPIPEIQDKVGQGATIAENGTIIETSGKEIDQDPELAEDVVTDTAEINETAEVAEQPEETESVAESKFNKSFDFGVVAVAVLAAFLFFFAVMKKKKKPVITATDESIEEKLDAELEGKIETEIEDTREGKDR